MDKSQVDGRRNFVSLVEIERDESLENGGWVLSDSITEEAFHNLRNWNHLPPTYFE